MKGLKPSMRLKVKGDTFFLPDPDGHVYFRNNLGSFRMEGSSIDQWIEKLIPVFNGQYTLEELTDGLPDPYRDQVYKITEVLYRNGIVCDLSLDHPHQLPDEILKKFASQIEFLNSFGDSGAFRFQTFRHSKVLAIGSGPFFVSLAAALFESGLPKFHMLITDSVPTSRQRLMDLAAHARKTDSEVAVQEVTIQADGPIAWGDVVEPFDIILYVSQEAEVEELKSLNTVCKEHGKLLLPAIFIQQVGMAGPLVHPEAEGCWESAWRRIHRSAVSKDPKLHTFSSTAGALLANVIAFEMLKVVTGVVEPELKNKFFLLNLETLEGEWHSFLPHPLVTGHSEAQWVEDFGQRIELSLLKNESNRLFSHFSQLTSDKAGIFHVWDEGELKQLPLAQCRVQVADPRSDGPAELLPEIVCTGMTHEEARREAGLSGIEFYASQLTDLFVSSLPSLQGADSSLVQSLGFVGVGVGETSGEAICRGIQKCLAEVLRTIYMDSKPCAFRVQLSEIMDNHCRYYLQALTTLHGEPVIGLGKEVIGFPTVWIGTGGKWYGSVGLNLTMALRKALQFALLQAQNQMDCSTTKSLEVSSVLLEEKGRQNIVIPSYNEGSDSEVLHSALQILKRHRKRLLVFNLALEPFLKEELAGVFGVLLREEGSR